MTETEDELARLADREHDVRPKLARAARAQALLDDDMLKAAFDGVREGLITNMAESELDEIVLDAKRLLKALRMVEAMLDKHVTTGKLAQNEIDDIMRQRHRLERYRGGV